MRPDGTWGVADTAAVVHRIRSLRGSEDSVFDVAVPGESEPSDDTRVTRFRDHEEAGATWWVEAIHPWRYGYREGECLAPRRHA